MKIILISYSCESRSLIDVLSEAVTSELVTDETVGYPRLGDCESWDELSREDQLSWRKELDTRLSTAGWKLIKLPSPGCLKNPRAGDAMALVSSGMEDSDELTEMILEFQQESYITYLFYGSRK